MATVAEGWQQRAAERARLKAEKKARAKAELAAGPWATVALFDWDTHVGYHVSVPERVLAEHLHRSGRYPPDYGGNAKWAAALGFGLVGFLIGFLATMLMADWIFRAWIALTQHVQVGGHLSMGARAMLGVFLGFQPAPLLGLVGWWIAPRPPALWVVARFTDSREKVTGPDGKQAANPNFGERILMEVTPQMAPRSFAVEEKVPGDEAHGKTVLVEKSIDPARALNQDERMDDERQTLMSGSWQRREVIKLGMIVLTFVVAIIILFLVVPLAQSRPPTSQPIQPPSVSLPAGSAPIGGK